jgi:type IV pilus assembly protein PilA
MKMNKKGFTLAELLIVVAIIAVLVAIAIPVFTNQLEKAREATDLANIRSGYAAAVIEFLEGDGSADITVTVPAKQTIFGSWVEGTNAKISTQIGSFAEEVDVAPPSSSTGWTITIDHTTGELTIAAA